jgi:heat shock protein HtpX
MPEVGVYHSPEVNAFATGPTKSRSLIAVSSGLLEKMDSEEIQGVLAHEMSHIKNGDMVTMTLLQGIVNAFVMFLARILAYAVSGRNGRNSYGSFFLFTILFQTIFMFFGWMIIAAYSRRREYRADAGGARLAGKAKMIAALKRLQRASTVQDQRAAHPAVQALKISPGKGKGLAALFATHPPLDMRIKELETHG